MKRVIITGSLAENYNSFSEILKLAKITLNPANTYMISANDDLKTLFLKYAKQHNLKTETWPEYPNHGNQNLFIAYPEMVRIADAALLFYDTKPSIKNAQFKVVASAWRLPVKEYKI